MYGAILQWELRTLSRQTSIAENYHASIAGCSSKAFCTATEDFPSYNGEYRSAVVSNVCCISSNFLSTNCGNELAIDTYIQLQMGLS